ncbi:hypothetical protein POTG_02010 [Paenibacillus sp. oral taxon 786 str. D14]|uniref:hypothetical protein n=1 Tax=Paenibacillus sp. oral taxon 786 TaxID=652715 RepID=UPI0001AFCFE2|nr:hypothetical protein [Paenibacillus sp. oral taxon 786]EES73258.1 hypothetical protein POTG_02010 [Paenibacillus sp. oral taxon 786 str. D14]
MNSSKTLYQVTIELRKDQLASKVLPWKLLVETNRYYEIKPITGSGSVKRLYKEKLNIAVHETKHYSAGTLAVSAFCKEEHIEEIRKYLIEQLDSKINNYMKDLELNKKALYSKLAIKSYT